MQLGPRAAGIFSKRYAPTFGIERHRCNARIGRDFFRSKDAPPGGQTSNTIAHFALDFERKESVCVVITDTEPDRLASRPSALAVLE
jgi:hypothetical protein